MSGLLIFEPVRALSDDELQFSIKVQSDSCVAASEHTAVKFEPFEINLVDKHNPKGTVKLICYWKNKTDDTFSLNLKNAVYDFWLIASLTENNSIRISSDAFDDMTCSASLHCIDEGVTDRGIPWIRNNYGQKIDKRNNVLLPERDQD